MIVIDENPAFFDLVGNVRAMRKLKPDPVPQELLQKILDAGVKAASGMNTQPWSFLVIREADGKQWFADHYRAAMETRFHINADVDPGGDSEGARQLRAIQYQMKHMQEFPLLLVICGLRDWPFKVPEAERVGLAPPNYGAIYPCVQNILLACRALGLGAALTTMHQVFEDELMDRFNIPEEWGVVVTMPIGYPMGKFGPVRRRPAERVTYYDNWGETGAGAKQ
ncbi:MAG: nitroreductase family protein [Gammaproteobacteria bacterium]|nr:nitroreductase family protein [Gammaproteobacteria bacterium]